MTIYECDKCEAILPPGARFCPRCGDPFDEAVPDDAQMLPPGPEPAPDAEMPLLPTKPVGEGPRKPRPRRNATLGAGIAALLVLSLLLLGVRYHAAHHALVTSPPPPVPRPAPRSLLPPRLTVRRQPIARRPIARRPPPARTPGAVLPPVAVATPQWRPVVTFRGAASQQTPPFTVGPRWQILWTTLPGDAVQSPFQIVIRRTGGPGQAAAPPVLTGAASGSREERGAGAYTLRINAAQPYRVRILDLR